MRVEINAPGAATPKVSIEESPARLVLDLPGTVMATAQSHIVVDSDGVKGVRIGMDGQHPPTTRVVVDLEHTCPYELKPSADGNLVLTLHTQTQSAAAAKSIAPKSSTPKLSAAKLTTSTPSAPVTTVASDTGSRCSSGYRAEAGCCCFHFD